MKQCLEFLSVIGITKEVCGTSLLPTAPQPGGRSEVGPISSTMLQWEGKRTWP